MDCGIKNSRFVKVQEAKVLLSSLGSKTFAYSLRCIKMNEIVNKFLLLGDKFMPELHLKQPGFTYSACGSLTRNKQRIEMFMQTGNTDFIYRDELDKACFQHDMAYRKSKEIEKRTQSDKVLRDKAFKIASDPNMLVIKED